MQSQIFSAGCSGIAHGYVVSDRVFSERRTVDGNDSRSRDIGPRDLSRAVRPAPNCDPFTLRGMPTRDQARVISGYHNVARIGANCDLGDPQPTAARVGSMEWSNVRPAA